MAEPHTNKYWNRATVSFGLPIILFVVFVIAIAVQPNAEASFSAYPIFTTIGFLFLITLFLWQIPCGYFVSQDKEILSQAFTDTNKRHWLVTIFLCYISAGIYPLWYIIYRKYSIDISDTNPNDKGEKEDLTSNRDTVSTPTTQKTPDTLAENARGKSVGSDKLTSTGIGLGANYLHDSPIISYLNNEEQPHYHFHDPSLGKEYIFELNDPSALRLFLKPLAIYVASMVITSDGVHLFVGQVSGDIHEYIPYGSIECIEINETDSTLFVTTKEFIISSAQNEYVFGLKSGLFGKYDENEIYDAFEYMDDKIKDNTSASHESLEETDKQNSASDQSLVSEAGETDTASQVTNEHNGGVEPVESIRNSLQRGDNIRATAGDQLQEGAYDQALQTNEEATKLYEETLETASGTDLIDAEEVKQKLTAVRDQREDIHRQRLQEK